MTAWIEALAALPFVVIVLGKITLLLVVAWSGHAALARCNPRWRVLLWRSVMLGLILLPMSELLVPKWEIAISQAVEPVPVALEAADQPETTPPYQPLPMPVPDLDSAILENAVVVAPVASFDPLVWVTANWEICLAAVWGMVTLLLAVRRIAGAIFVLKIITQASDAPPVTCRLIEQLANQLIGPNCSVEVKIVPEECSPYLAGIFRPVVVFPLRMTEPDRREDLRAAAAHELAHLHSRDHLWSQLAGWIAVPLWFHPLVWKFASAHSAACEEVADAEAAGHSGGCQSYSRILARIALLHFERVPHRQTVPIVRDSEIMLRLRRLDAGLTADRLGPRWVASMSAMSIALCMCLGSVQPVVGENATDKDLKTTKAAEPKSPVGRIGRMRTLHLGKQRVDAIAFDPSGKYLVTAGWDSSNPENLEGWKKGIQKGRVRLWEVKSGKEVGEFEGDYGAVFEVAFSPDGKTLATAGRMAGKPRIGSVKLWDVQTRKLKKTLLGHFNWVLSVAFSPDGRTLASSGFERNAKIWDVDSGTLIHTLPKQDATIRAIRFSPDGRLLALGCSNGAVKLCDTNTWEIVATLDGSPPPENELNFYYQRDVVFSPDGRLIATGGELTHQGESTSPNPGLLRIWDVQTRQRLNSIETKEPVSGVAFSPDGAALASCGLGNFEIWDTKSGNAIFSESPAPGSSSESVAFSLKHGIIANADGIHTVRIMKLIEE